MDFIFMLTRDDSTVANALEIVEAVRPIGLQHIGFKDVGAAPETLRRLAAAIRDAGAVGVDGDRVDLARRRTALDCARARSRRRLPDGRSQGPRRALRLLAGQRDALSALPGEARRPSDPARRVGRAKWRRIAAPSPGSAAPASTFSPIGRPRPSRSISSPPAGADAETRAGRGRGLDRRRRAGRRDPRRRRRRLHHRHGGDRWLLRARRRAARGAAQGGAGGLRARRRANAVTSPARRATASSPACPPRALSPIAV